MSHMWTQPGGKFGSEPEESVEARILRHAQEGQLRRAADQQKRMAELEIAQLELRADQAEAEAALRAALVKVQPPAIPTSSLSEPVRQPDREEVLCYERYRMMHEDSAREAALGSCCLEALETRGRLERFLVRAVRQKLPPVCKDLTAACFEILTEDGPWRLVVSEIAEVHDISEELRRSNDALAMPRARCQAQFPAQDP
ncbi:unnamed protein product [Effrenium voratum]|nr:unnamed protein product [Effrenium voratum]